MANEIISYLEMCTREAISLQRGMNYRIRPDYSVILMSVRNGSPYADRFEDDGSTIVYEGHDVPKSNHNPNPKVVNQTLMGSSGKINENGKFFRAAQEYVRGLRTVEKVRVYEKIKQGIWSYNGMFNLVDSWSVAEGGRLVFKFKLVATDEIDGSPVEQTDHKERRRIIPTSVKVAVWKRDGGKCVVCGSTDDLHFDHIIPWSKGGSSQTADNIQLLCCKHNLQKHDKIE